MSNNYAFTATKRDRAGKGVARALRREGMVPAVIYGDNKEPLSISIPSNDINVEYNKGQMRVTLCEIDVAGDKHMVLARDVQLHPVTDVVIHADFLRVTKKTMIAVSVPVNFLNEETCPGLKAGGILNVSRYRVELMCSAMALPETLDVDLASKEVGDSVNISDALLPEGVTPVIDDRDFTIGSIVAPKSAAEIEAEEDAEAADDAAAEAGEGEDGETADGGDAAEGDAKED